MNDNQIYDVGVIVGRFQVPELHNGHHGLIASLLKSHKQCIIFLGTTSTLGTKSNPLDFASRKGMFSKFLYGLGYENKLHILPLADIPGNDIEWSKSLDNSIKSLFPANSVCLYGSRDSFIESYKGCYPTHKVDEYDSPTGTDVRNLCKTKIINSAEFRLGQIYQAMNRWPAVFPAVDIAVISKHDSGSYYVLVGQKEFHDGYSFPGGFVSPTDLSYEYAASRELSEEFEIGISPKEMEYIRSFKINDPRYTGEEKIITSFYLSEQPAMTEIAIKEEFIATTWIMIDKANIPLMSKIHQELLEALINHLKRRDNENRN